MRSAETNKRPHPARYLPWSIYIFFRPPVRYFHYLIRHPRTRVFTEKYLHVIPSTIKSALFFALRKQRSEQLSMWSVRYAQIDYPGRPSPKIWIELRQANWRLDVTGLRKSGVSMAADIRNLNRGNIVVGAGWELDFQHSLSSQTTIQSYRYNTYETVRSMFVEHLHWQQTPEYHSFLDQLRVGHTPYGIKSEEELNQRGDQLKKLYEDMRCKGYKMSQSVGSDYWDEAHVYIDAKGELCLGRHANHRIAIARLLGVTRIPVLLGGVHRNFAKTLSAQSNIKEEIYDYIESNFG